MEKLAILGGKPVREKKIYYGRQWIDEDDIRAVSDTLRSDWITQGPAIATMERVLCELGGAQHAVAVSNGTAALHVAALAAGVEPGDEVVTTPITFAASANCALYCGARPVFADIDPDTYNIDVNSVAAHMTERTKAVVAVDYTGAIADIPSLKALCKQRGALLIEDAAHSIGGSLNGVRVGEMADITTFSFHPVKTVTAGEGGAVLTNDDAIYRSLLLYHTHGITKDEHLFEHPCDGPWYYEQQELGYNYRITDFQAALATSQIKKFDRFAARRKQIVQMYDEAFQDVPQLKLQRMLPGSDNCKHLYVLQLVLENLSCGRRAFFDALAAENVQPQVHYIPVYYFPYYERLGYRRGLCPNAERLYDRILSIPLYPAMTDEDVSSVITAVKKVCAWYAV